LSAAKSKVRFALGGAATKYPKMPHNPNEIQDGTLDGWNEETDEKAR
jgi:hypothetical protein